MKPRGENRSLPGLARHKPPYQYMAGGRLLISVDLKSKSYFTRKMGSFRNSREQQLCHANSGKTTGWSSKRWRGTFPQGEGGESPEGLFSGKVLEKSRSPGAAAPHWLGGRGGGCRRCRARPSLQGPGSRHSCLWRLFCRVCPDLLPALAEWRGSPASLPAPPQQGFSNHTRKGVGMAGQHKALLRPQQGGK